MVPRHRATERLFRQKADFDDFLREEGLLEEVEDVAAGRALTDRVADGSSNDDLDALDGAAVRSDEFDAAT